MIGCDAWNKKTGAHASTLEMELMHEAEKQGAMHHFSSEHGPAEPLHDKRREPSRLGLRTLARKPTEFGFRTQTPGLKFRKCGPGGRLGLRTQTPGPEIQKVRPGRQSLPVLARQPAKPMNSVSERELWRPTGPESAREALPVRARFP